MNQMNQHIHGTWRLFANEDHCYKTGVTLLHFHSPFSVYVIRYIKVPQLGKCFPMFLLSTKFLTNDFLSLLT